MLSKLKICPQSKELKQIVQKITNKGIYLSDNNKQRKYFLNIEGGGRGEGGGGGEREKRKKCTV